jgi:uncharacterized protein YuzE
MKITWDRSADAAYIYLTEIKSGQAAHTVALAPSEARGHMINLDFDAGNRLLGIEVLDASAVLPIGFENSSDVEFIG